MTEPVADKVRRTRREQGLPDHVEDPVALANIAALVLLSQGEEDAA